MSMSVGCVSVVPTMTSLGSLSRRLKVRHFVEIISEGPCEDKRKGDDVGDVHGDVQNDV
jgi:hypothetical protein